MHIYNSYISAPKVTGTFGFLLSALHVPQGFNSPSFSAREAKSSHTTAVQQDDRVQKRYLQSEFWILRRFDIIDTFIPVPMLCCEYVNQLDMKV